MTCQSLCAPENTLTSVARGVVLALQTAALIEDVLLLCDNEAVLCVIKKWVGQGGKTTLATAPDADILQEIILLLTQRVRAGMMMMSFNCSCRNKI
jgi:hypothetical protein